MKKLLFIALFVAAFAGTQKEADAHFIGVPHAHVGHTANVVFGYGWWGVGVPFYQWPVYGYSYYPYWGYQVRYATYAAIAYSAETGKVGWAWGSSTRWNAERAAVSQCIEADCRSMVWVQGGCAALSSSEDRSKLGWGYGVNRYDAIRAANRGCAHSSGERCASLAWVCSY